MRPPPPRATWPPADGRPVVPVAPCPEGRGLRMLRCSFGLGMTAAFAALASLFLLQGEFRAAGLFGEPSKDPSLVHGPLFWLSGAIVLGVALVALLAAPDRPATRDVETLALWGAVSGWIAWLPLAGVSLLYLVLVPDGLHLLPVLGASAVALAGSVALWVSSWRS